VVLEQKRRLGRGLDALLGAYPAELSRDMPEASSGEGPGLGASRRTLPVALIERNRKNPRRDFRQEDLEELAASLSQHGMVQPIVVRPINGAGERYEIIAGERRWRAAQIAGLHEVPVNVLDVSDREALELAIVENVQRTDLNPIEEARGYQALIEEFDYPQATLGERIGKSRVHVTNTLRLLRLPQPVLDMLQAGTISAGHGRALLSAGDPVGLARLIAEKGLSVREAERLTQSPREEPRPAPRRKKSKSADVVALEKELTNQAGIRVEVNDDGEGKGHIVLWYRDLEQLDAICRKLRR
jgi:ParB family chromosome partitioning protein